MERQLVAILAIDVVGYSKLMRHDEEATLANLQTCRHLIDGLIASHEGRIFNTAGDSVLAAFQSPVKAVRCATEIQRGMAVQNKDRDENSRMHLRIGVNLGDVINEGGNLYGDGVNIAARLEALSVPQGMCISQAVHEQVRDRLDIAFEDIGQREVKNIDRPVQVFGWCLGNASSRPPEHQDSAGSELSIAVLPFANLSGDPNQEFLADGITEEIITTLSKVPELRVVARHSTSGYKNQSVDVKKIGIEQNASHILEGSVRKSGNRVRISAQLIDTKSGLQLWAERYDREIEDIFDLQDEISLKIATALQGEIIDGDMALTRGAGTKNLEAWTNHTRALALMRGVSRETNAQARKLLELAVEQDPNYAAALSTLALTHGMDARHGFTQTRETSIAEARKHAQRSIELDPGNSEAFGILGFIDTLEGKTEDAIAKYNTSLAMNPNHAEVTIRLALTLIFNGQPEEAVRMAEKALRLSPKYPPWFAGTYGFALRSAGRYREAIKAFTEYSQAVEGFGHVDLAIVYVMLDDLESARGEARKVLKYRPEFRVSDWQKTQNYKNPDGAKQDVEALIKAGLPE